MSDDISPLNDFVATMILENVASDTGVVTAISSGTITGFLATSDSPDATAADANWSVSGTYIGGANDYEAGTWMWQIDAAVLTYALMEAAFGSSKKAYFIVQKTNDKRVVKKLRYRAVRYATDAE